MKPVPPLRSSSVSQKPLIDKPASRLLSLLNMMRQNKFAMLAMMAACSIAASCSSPHARAAAADEMQPGRYSRPADYAGIEYSSFYLPMRDGVRIAVDLYRPKGLKRGQRLPTILEQTRYGRSFQFRAPFRWFLNNTPTFSKLFVPHGYAWVKIDVRGSGASFGQVPYPWSIDEIRDGDEVVNWIIRQPWSDGKVGALGLSYQGEASEFLLVNRNPAVKAIAPRYAMWDAYADMVYPGGVYFDWFVKIWSTLGIKLDRGDFNGPPFKWYVPVALEGFRPVSADNDGSLLAAALKSHRTFDLTKGIGEGFRDDAPSADAARLAQQFSPAVQEQLRETLASGLGAISVINPALHVREIEGSKAAVFGIDGWFDGAYTRGTIQRYLTLHNPQRLMLGPWIHGIQRDVFSGEKFDLGAELLRFFDYQLKGIDDGAMNGPPIAYYTMVENKWKTAAQWPLANQSVTPLFFEHDHVLSPTKPDGEGEDEYMVDSSAATGRRSRWEPLMGNETAGGSSVLDYGDRATADRKLLTYQTAALPADTEVTGHPVVTLYVKSTASDGEFFAYLEDVSPDGSVRYVTEGELRAIHRKVAGDGSRFCSIVPCRSYLKKDASPMTAGVVAELAFDLQPTSYLFKKGHSIRIALAGADQDHFQVLPGPAPTWRVQCNAAFASRIDLPIIPR